MEDVPRQKPQLSVPRHHHESLQYLLPCGEAYLTRCGTVFSNSWLWVCEQDDCEFSLSKVFSCEVWSRTFLFQVEGCGVGRRPERPLIICCLSSVSTVLTCLNSMYYLDLRYFEAPNSTRKPNTSHPKRVSTYLSKAGAILSRFSWCSGLDIP